MGHVRRRKFIVAAAALAVPFTSFAQQQSSRTFRIGFLAPVSATSFAGRVTAFKQRLNELGYAEGKNIVIEYRWADGKYDRLPSLAAELVQLKVDVIVTLTTPATLAAKQASGVIPIVMVSVGDPVGTGFVASLARPGGNITGVANFVGDTSKKQLDLLVATVPRLSLVAVLVNPNNQSTASVLKTVQAASQTMGVRILPVPARTPEEIGRAFSTMKRDRAQALVLLGDGFFLQQRVQITDLAAKARIPATYNVREYAEVGGLMSYGANGNDIVRRAAVYVDKILKGAKPADIPVEQPNTLELVINLKTARALDLTVPRELLLRADEVIQR